MCGGMCEPANQTDRQINKQKITKNHQSIHHQHQALPLNSLFECSVFILTMKKMCERRDWCENFHPMTHKTLCALQNNFSKLEL